jgi:hypothetical protein
MKERRKKVGRKGRKDGGREGKREERKCCGLMSRVHASMGQRLGL